MGARLLTNPVSPPLLRMLQPRAQRAHTCAACLAIHQHKELDHAKKAYKRRSGACHSSHPFVSACSNAGQPFILVVVVFHRYFHNVESGLSKLRCSNNDAIHEQERPHINRVFRPPLPAQVVSAVGATFQTIRTHASHPCGRTGGTFESSGLMLSLRPHRHVRGRETSP